MRRRRPMSTEELYVERFVVGARVRLTGTFLKNTGQAVGGEGHKSWLVAECPCGCADERTAADGLVAVDERATTPNDDGSPRWRHFAWKNLMVEGAPPLARFFP